MKENKDVWIWMILAIVVLLLLFGGWGWGGYGMMGFGMGFGFLFMLLFWTAIVLIVITIINTSQPRKNDNVDSLEILKKRYARGEITKKQYIEMKKELSEVNNENRKFHLRCRNFQEL